MPIIFPVPYEDEELEIHLRSLTLDVSRGLQGVDLKHKIYFQRQLEGLSLHLYEILCKTERFPGTNNLAKKR